MITRSLLRISGSVLQARQLAIKPICKSRIWETKDTRRILPISHRRGYVSKTEADEKIEELQDLYATAKDEFEIAAEETQKKSVYAEADREAAKEELAKLKAAFDKAIEESEAEVSAEIKSRVGQRIRELERAVQAMEERAMEE